MKQNAIQCLEKNRVMCILQTQSVTLFFLYFYYPHELESGSNYTSWLVYIEKNEFKIEKSTKILTGSENTPKTGGWK